jgi:hypothetical protein
MRKKKSVKKGSARMRELGFVGVTVWITPAEAAALDVVRSWQKRATWAREALAAAILAARKADAGR